MSLDINVYCKQLSDDLIPKIVDRLNDYDMTVEINPDFSFSCQTVFLSFKFQFNNPNFDILKGKTLTTGFELYINEFDLAIIKEQLNPKPNFWKKLFEKKQPEIHFAKPDVEERLIECKKVVTFIWHVADSFDVRFASLTSAILTELTNGVCEYPADDIWYENENFVEKTYQEIIDYENTFRENAIRFYEFNGW